MPIVKMLKTVSGAVDGVHIKEFLQGETYEISENLAKDFSSLGAITFCEEDGVQEKAEAAAPKNKAHKFAPKNKQELGDNNGR